MSRPSSTPDPVLFGGDHFAAHGNGVPNSRRVRTTERMLPPMVEVFTRMNARSEKQASVVLHAARGGFVFDHFMSSHGARELAAYLLQAADVAEAVTAKASAVCREKESQS